jgi:hypothetical protein
MFLLYTRLLTTNTAWGRHEHDSMQANRHKRWGHKQQWEHEQWQEHEQWWGHEQQQVWACMNEGHGQMRWAWAQTNGGRGGWANKAECYDHITPCDGNTHAFAKEQMKGSASALRGSAQDGPMIKQALSKCQNDSLPGQWNNKSLSQAQTPREWEV